MKNSSYIEENRKAYNDMAPVYKVRAENNEFIIYPDILEFAEILSKRFKKVSILDVGPGSGVFLDYFSKRDFETSAIDISEEMIKIALQRSKNTKEYFIGNFLEYNFHNKKFNGIFAKAVFHLFSKEDSDNFIKKSYNLLENLGVFYLSVFLRDESKEGLKIKRMKGKEYLRFHKDWTEGELEKLLKKCPFKIIKTFTIAHGTMKKWSGIFKKID